MINKNIKRIQGFILRVSKGFTLIETLVAVLLLTTAIAGPLTIASKGLSAALIARDQMIAFYLAQDAIEFVRFARDSNKLSGANWLAGNGSSNTKDLSACLNALGCYIDPTTGAVIVCPVGGCPVLKKNVNGTQVSFSYSSGTDAANQLRRTITLTQPATTEVVLTVSISWRAQSGVTRTISVRENLYDWQ